MVVFTIPRQTVCPSSPSSFVLFIQPPFFYADVKETDYSSASDTQKSRLIEPPDIPDGEHQASEFMATSNAFDVPSSPPTIRKSSFPDADQADPASPSTPPRRVNSRSAKLEPKTPSPPKGLPELPTPSSSDDSNDGPKIAKIPKLGAAHHNKWLQTPKPPGGWLATPQPARSAENAPLDESQTPDLKVDRIPETPIASEAGRFVAKTPKPPGGWATPAPTSSKSAEPDYTEANGQGSQLLTPVNSLPRGLVLNSKTPNAPGGWANTPAARKSVLKVRFDPQSPEVKGESSSYAQESVPDSRSEDLSASELGDPSQSGGARSVSLPSPRSPRRPKATIRVLDAFGREESPSSSPKKEIRNGIRVLDAMGRDVKEEQIEEQETMDESTTPPDVLVSRLRQGLNELVEDIDAIDE
jgi:hypothetical protein